MIFRVIPRMTDLFSVLVVWQETVLETVLLQYVVRRLLTVHQVQTIEIERVMRLDERERFSPSV